MHAAKTLQLRLAGLGSFPAGTWRKQPALCGQNIPPDPGVIAPSSLVTFDLNMSSGMLTLSFSNDINVSSLVVEKIALQGSRGFSQAGTISERALVNSSTTNSVATAASVDIKLGVLDFDYIKSTSSLATNHGTTTFSTTGPDLRTQREERIRLFDYCTSSLAHRCYENSGGSCFSGSFAHIQV